MIGIEHFLRLADVLLDLALLAPWQAEQHVEIVADDGRLGAHRLHAPELLELGLGLLARFLRQLGLADLLGQLGNLVAAILVAAELVLDRLQLLVEVIFALGLLHLPLHAAADPTLDLQHRQFAFHEGHDHFEALERILLHQQRLLVGHLGVHGSGDGIGQFAGIVDIAQLLDRLFAELLVELGIFTELLDHLAHHGNHFATRRGHGVDDRHAGFDMRAGRGQIFEGCAVAALNQHAHGAIGELEQLEHLRDHADIVEVVAHRIVATGIKLRQQENVLAAFHRRFERRNRFVASDEQRHDHTGKDHDIAQGEEGVGMGHQQFRSGPSAAIRREYGDTRPEAQRRAPNSMWMTQYYNANMVNL